MEIAELGDVLEEPDTIFNCAGYAVGVNNRVVPRRHPLRVRVPARRDPDPPGAPGGGDGVLDALATLRPSAHTDLGGPALPGSGDVLAILGSTALDELPALLARCPGQGHGVLLDVGSWGSGTAPVFTAAGSPASVEATAAALRGTGWAVTVATRGARPEDVWDELVSCPAPRAGVS